LTISIVSLQVEQPALKVSIVYVPVAMVMVP
jgi:hypothetical protein